MRLRTSYLIRWMSCQFLQDFFKKLRLLLTIILRLKLLCFYLNLLLLLLRLRLLLWFIRDLLIFLLWSCITLCSLLLTFILSLIVAFILRLSLLIALLLRLRLDLDWLLKLSHYCLSFSKTLFSFVSWAFETKLFIKFLKHLNVIIKGFSVFNLCLLSDKLDQKDQFLS